MYTTTPDFQMLRDQLAVSSVISGDDIKTQQLVDQQANPHNEPYHNKRPRRDRAEIESDLMYRRADKILRTQYGDQYTKWLSSNGFVVKWDFIRRA